MERAEKGKEGRKEKKVIGLILAQPRYFTWPLFQNEGRCSAFDMEIIFHSHANKTHLHKKGCATSFPGFSPTRPTEREVHLATL